MLMRRVPFYYLLILLYVLHFALLPMAICSGWEAHFAVVLVAIYTQHNFI